jgi:hypothetical protein
MKKISLLHIAGLALLISGGTASAQSTTTTTTSSTYSDGTVSDFTPDAITVRSSSTTTPTSYSYTKTTTYVDENGNPVSVETVRSGAPVTVYYDRDGDNWRATKVVVHHTVTPGLDTAPGTTTTIIKKTTTTTESP